MSDIYNCGAWLLQMLKKHKRKAVELSEFLKCDRTYVYKLTKNERPIKSEWVPLIEKFFGEIIPGKGIASPLPIERVIGIGIWIEPGETQESAGLTSSAIFHPDYSKEKCRIYKFKGDSMNAAGIYNNDILTCVGYEYTLDVPLDGKLVVIERDKVGIIETSVRRAAVYDDRTEFETFSRTQVHKPLIVDKRGKVKDSLHEKLTIKAVVVAVARFTI